MASGEDLKKAFEAFSKFGDSHSTGKTVTLTQCDKWFKQAKVIDGKKITTTDTAICYNKHKYEITFQMLLQLQYIIMKINDLIFFMCNLYTIVISG